jgi:hypothetical protein
MDYPPILNLESSIVLPKGRRKRAKLLSNEAYTFPRMGCQRRSDFQVFSFSHPYSCCRPPAVELEP